MKTAQITVYKFEELSEEAQKIAINDYINSIDYIELDWLIWQFEDEAKEKGFENPKFQYSLSNSQGDGLSFSFDYFNSEKLTEIIKEITSKKTNWFLDIVENSIYSISGKGNKGHYCYAKENQVELEENYNSFNYPNIMELHEKILEKIRLLYIYICSEFEQRGYEQIEHEFSEENARFWLIENDFTFLENGQQFFI
jgi:hypothetical protein